MFGPSITAAYATQALVFIARKGHDAHGAEAIASRTGVPQPYLLKILHTLSEKGLVIARRGNRGGYRLARSPGEITLFDVLTAVDGDDVFERCLLGLGRCSSKRACPVHALWSDHRRTLRSHYRELTLGELAGFDRFDVERDYHFGCNGKSIIQKRRGHE